MASLTFHGHATFTVEAADGTRIVIDPFFDDNPAADIRRSEAGRVDYVLCTHGHTDHFADAIPLACETGATLVGSYEIAAFAESQGVAAHAMHIGGRHAFPFGSVKMTAAVHGGMVHGDETGQFTTSAAGLLVEVDGKRVHHAGDTGLTLDMQLLRGQVDVALLPIGDNFTMGPEDAARAVEFVEPAVVVPMHYDTWPVIEQDPERFRALVGGMARVEIMAPGETLAL